MGDKKAKEAFLRNLVTGCWLLEKGVDAQAFVQYVALLLIIKSTEYLVNPVSKIQYSASLGFADSICFSLHRRFEAKLR